MTIEWPDSLVAELAERRCIIILGAGASAGCVDDNGVSPAAWTPLLLSGIELMAQPDDKEAAKGLLKDGNFLDAAQVVVDSLDPADFGQFIRQALDDPGFAPSELHRTVMAIDPKIIITTNYDRIFDLLATEMAPTGYNVCKYYEGHLLNDIRSRRRLIVKAHGCVTDPTRIVLTRKQYFDARRFYPQFFAVLDALFLTNTLLFIGSGFNGDPDIELLLQNANISAPSEHRHYAVVEDSRHPSVVEALESTHNLKLLTYDAGDHGQVTEALKDLSERVDSHRA